MWRNATAINFYDDGSTGCSTYTPHLDDMTKPDNPNQQEQPVGESIMGEADDMVGKADPFHLSILQDALPALEGPSFVADAIPPTTPREDSEEIIEDQYQETSQDRLEEEISQRQSKRLAARRRRQMRRLLLQPLSERAIRFAARQARRAEREANSKARKEHRRHYKDRHYYSD